MQQYRDGSRRAHAGVAVRALAVYTNPHPTDRRTRPSVRLHVEAISSSLSRSRTRQPRIGDGRNTVIRASRRGPCPAGGPCLSPAAADRVACNSAPRVPVHARRDACPPARPPRNSRFTCTRPHQRTPDICPPPLSLTSSCCFSSARFADNDVVPAALRSVPSHLHRSPDVHISRFQIFLYLVYPCFLVVSLYSLCP